MTNKINKKNEITFRAWDKKRKIMEYDIELGKYDKNIPEIENFIDYLIYPDYDVMEFTKVYDINGKKIYESDIIEIWEDNEKIIQEEVKWLPSFGGWNFSGYLIYNNLMKKFNKKIDLKVKGNIYENPDLLKNERK